MRSWRRASISWRAWRSTRSARSSARSRSAREEIEALLKSKKARWKLVETELQEVAQKYGDKRRTVLSAGAELVYDAEAYVVHEDTTVVVTRDGWMKRLGEIKDPAQHARARGRPRQVDPARQHARQPGAVLQLRRRLRHEGRQRPRHHRLRRAGAVAAELQGRRARHRRARSCRRQTARRSRRRPSHRWLVATRPRHGLLLPSRPQRDDQERAALRAHARKATRSSSSRPADGDTITAATAGGKVLAFPAEELPELAGAGRGVILMRLDKSDRLVGAVCHALDQPAHRRRRRRQRAPLPFARGGAPRPEGPQGAEAVQGGRPRPAARRLSPSHRLVPHWGLLLGAPGITV